LTYFRAGLLDYLRITTNNFIVETLNELKEVASRYENNCTGSSEKKLILHMKKMETAPSKAMTMHVYKSRDIKDYQQAILYFVQEGWT
jgi:hypothetical protein